MCRAKHSPIFDVHINEMSNLVSLNAQLTNSAWAIKVYTHKVAGCQIQFTLSPLRNVMKVENGKL